MDDKSIKTSIISQHNSKLCISTGDESVAKYIFDTTSKRNAFSTPEFCGCKKKKRDDKNMRTKKCVNKTCLLSDSIQKCSKFFVKRFNFFYSNLLCVRRAVRYHLVLSALPFDPNILFADKQRRPNG